MNISISFSGESSQRLTPSTTASQNSPKRYYVYGHFDAQGVPFYIGKGTGRRVWSEDRHPLWSRYVQNHLHGKYTVVILVDDLTSTQAEEVPDFDYLRLEMKKKGVTLQLLWEEYRSIHSDGYSRSQFCELYQKHGKTLDPVMRFDHKAGEKLFVDFSGDRPSYVDRETGEVVEPELFIAAMGASSRIFAVAIPSQQIPDWTMAHIAAFE